MTTYRMRKEITQVIVQRYWEEFDTSDQSAWDDLRRRLDSSGIDLEDFPEEAPDDASSWFEAYKSLDQAEYSNQDDDDWIGERKGLNETSFILEDTDGNEVMSEDE